MRLWRLFLVVLWSAILIRCTIRLALVPYRWNDSIWGLVAAAMVAINLQLLLPRQK